MVDIARKSGSKKGVEETMESLFPHVLHVFDVRENRPH